ncbi:DNA glycosylase AlkZ-like family protein [Kribbella sp. NPDC055071]
MDIPLRQALAWRSGRQFLIEGAGSVKEVVGRLVAVGAHSGDPELAVRRRLSVPGEADVAQALQDGRVMKTYAFRGATHFMTPAGAGVHLALRAASRMWELPSWVSHYELGAQDWPALREVVRGVVSDGPVTRAELIAGVTADRRFSHLGPGLAHTSDTLLKPFAWQGDLCFGPVRDGQPTYQSPEAIPGWSGIPELELAGREAVRAYFDAYGPATADNLQYWLGNCLSAGRKRITRWLSELSDELVDITVDGEPMLHAKQHLDALAQQPVTKAVTLLPGYDQWVLGPGTADARVVPAKHRAEITRGAGLVLTGGVLTGTWTTRKDTLTISWFPRSTDTPPTELESAVNRLATLLGRNLHLI